MLGMTICLNFAGTKWFRLFSRGTLINAFIHLSNSDGLEVLNKVLDSFVLGCVSKLVFETIEYWKLVFQLMCGVDEDIWKKGMGLNWWKFWLTWGVPELFWPKICAYGLLRTFWCLEALLLWLLLPLISLLNDSLFWFPAYGKLVEFLAFVLLKPSNVGRIAPGQTGYQWHYHRR